MICALCPARGCASYSADIAPPVATTWRSAPREQRTFDTTVDIISSCDRRDGVPAVGAWTGCFGRAGAAPCCCHPSPPSRDLHISRIFGAALPDTSTVKTHVGCITIGGAHAKCAHTSAHAHDCADASHPWPPTRFTCEASERPGAPSHRPTRRSSSVDMRVATAHERAAAARTSRDARIPAAAASSPAAPSRSSTSTAAATIRCTLAARRHAGAALPPLRCHPQQQQRHVHARRRRRRPLPIAPTHPPAPGGRRPRACPKCRTCGHDASRCAAPPSCARQRAPRPPARAGTGRPTRARRRRCCHAPTYTTAHLWFRLVQL